MRRKMLKLAALGLAMLPLVGGTCTTDKIVEIVIAAAVEGEFIGEGIENTHDKTDMIDVKMDLDLQKHLDDADVDPNDLDADEFKVSRIFWKCTVPQGGRTIEGGLLEVSRGGGAAQTMVQDFAVSMAAVNDWQDITGTLGPGIDLLNGLIHDCLVELQGGPAAVDTDITYHVVGNSLPMDVESNFQWRVKVQFTVPVSQTYTVLDI